MKSSLSPRLPVKYPTLAALLLAACSGPSAGTTAWTGPPQGQKDVRSGSEVERFFPLVDGNVYHYVTLDEMNGEGLLVARVLRVDAARGELQFPAGARRFEYTPEGVRLVSGGGRLDEAFVLKRPIEVGSSWRGEHGGQTRIIAVGAAVDVPAGHFDGCVQTLEERGGDRPTKYATTFCPDVGVVVLEAAAGANFERAELKTYGPPVAIGPDGLKRIPE